MEDGESSIEGIKGFRLEASLLEMKGHLSTLTQIFVRHFQKKKFQGTGMFLCDTCVHDSLKVVFSE